jgi:hypothetical protein
MPKIAPHANISIPLSLGSITGLRYKTMHCIECGEPIIERNNEKMLRVGSNDMPEIAHVGADGSIPCVCRKCSQKYSIVVALSTKMSANVGIPLYMQPQSIFMIPEPVKRLRDVYCMECGKAFYSISDRVKLVSDNTMPTEILDPNRLGPMEVWCKFHYCKQRWSIMA